MTPYTLLFEANSADTKNPMWVYIWNDTGTLWVLDKDRMAEIERTAHTLPLLPVHYRTARPGMTYVHFKGGRYVVLMFARDFDSQEEVTVYTSLTYGTTWVRDSKEWEGLVERDDQVHYRFRPERG